MKTFPDQNIINAIKAKYNLPYVKVNGVGEGEVVEYDENYNYEYCYYYEEGGDGMSMFGDGAEWDEKGNLIYSDFDWIK